MNWGRTIALLSFELRHGVFRAKGLVFIVPFLLFWFVMFRWLNRDVSTWFAKGDGVLAMSLLFDPSIASALFVDQPPVLSVYFLLALATAPFFTMLAAHDQSSSDIGSGYLRFLCGRCRRIELYVSRFLAALCLLMAAHVVICSLAVWLSVIQDEYPLRPVLGYAGQILLTLLLYLSPLVAFMALASAVSRSAVGALVLGMVAYLALLVLIWAGNFLLPGNELMGWLLPSATRYRLFGIDPQQSILAIAALPLYTLAYGWAGWSVFRNRNF